MKNENLEITNEQYRELYDYINNVAAGRHEDYKKVEKNFKEIRNLIYKYLIVNNILYSTQENINFDNLLCLVQLPAPNFWNFQKWRNNTGEWMRASGHVKVQSWETYNFYNYVREIIKRF